MKKHIISSHKSHYNKIIKNFPDRNFFDVLNYLRKNNTFPFVNFKDENVNYTNDSTNEKDSLGKSEGYELSTNSDQVDLYFIFMLIEKYLFLQSVLNNCIHSYMNDYNLIVNILARRSDFSTIYRHYDRLISK